MKNTFRISKMPFMNQPRKKWSYFKQIRFMKTLTSEEREDFKDVRIINANPKFLENGN